MLKACEALKLAISKRLIRTSTDAAHAVNYSDSADPAEEPGLAKLRGCGREPT
jgi:hypothetical protein